MNLFKVGTAMAVGFVALMLLTSSIYKIDETERGVVLRNGAVTTQADPGLHFKLPLFDEVQRINMETHLLSWKDESAMAGYSRDQQPALIAVSVSWRVTNPLILYGDYRSLEGVRDRVIIPRANEQVRNVFGRFNAVEAVQQRARLNLEIADAVKSAINTEDSVVYVESVQVENIDFSDAYEQSVEQRMLAEVEVQRLQQNAAREQVQAEIVVIQATAEAEAIRQRGEAEADAIRARGAALRDNPILIDLEAVNKWDGKTPVTMVPGGTVPFMDALTRP